MRIYRPHGTQVCNALAFTPDGSRLASCSLDATTVLTDLNSRETLWRRHTRQVPGSIAISPDGRFVATGPHWTAHAIIRDINTGSHLRILSEFRGGNVAFDPTNGNFWRVSEWTYGMPTLAGFKPTSWEQIPEILFPFTACSTIDISSTGLLAAGVEPRGFFVASSTTLQPTWIFTNVLNAVPTCLKFSPDGQHIAAVVRKDLYVFKLNERDPILQHSIPDRFYQAAAWSPDGQHLIAGGNDKIVRAFHIPTKQIKNEFMWRIGEVMDVAYSPDGLSAAAAGRSGKIVVWDID